MNCGNCNAVLSIDQESRKLPYCSENCRSRIYAKMRREKDVSTSIKNNNFDRFKVFELKQMGFEVTVAKKVE